MPAMVAPETHRTAGTGLARSTAVRRFAAIGTTLALAVGMAGASATTAAAVQYQEYDFMVLGPDGLGVPGATVQFALYNTSPEVFITATTDGTGTAHFYEYPSEAAVGTEPYGPGAYLEAAMYSVEIMVPDASIYDDGATVYTMPAYNDGEAWPRSDSFDVPYRFQLPTDFGLTIDCTTGTPSASAYMTPLQNDHYYIWESGGEYYPGWVQATVNGQIRYQGDYVYGPLGQRMTIPLDTLALYPGDVVGLSISGMHGEVTASATVGCAPTGTANSRYVTHVYQDLLGRTPDDAGLNGWVAALNGGTPRVAVSNGITYSTEFRSVLVTSAYQGYLDRDPEAAGLSSWLTAMETGVTVSQMASGFIASDEYYAASGSTPEGWVEALYADVLERGAGTAEVAAWAGELRRGASRSAVAMGFLLSTERLNTVVEGHYWYLLGRGVDTAGQASWVNILQAGGRDEAVIGGILASNEYYAMS